MIEAGIGKTVLPNGKVIVTVVDELLNSDALDINLLDEFSNGETALIKACRKSHSKVAKHLLRNPNVNVNVQNEFGVSALHLASRNKLDDVVRVLLKNESIIVNIFDSDGWTQLHYAVNRLHIQTSSILIYTGNADVNAKDKSGMTVLHYACLVGYSSLVVAQLNAKGTRIYELDDNGTSALDYAENHNKRDCVLQNENVIQSLLNLPELRVNHQHKTYGNTILHWCSQRGYLTSTLQILRLDVDVNIRNINGVTALHLACLNRHNNLITPLVDAGAKVFIQDAKCQFRITPRGQLHFFSPKNQFPGELISPEELNSNLICVREITKVFIKSEMHTNTKAQFLSLALHTNEKLSLCILGRLLRDEEDIKLKKDDICNFLNVALLYLLDDSVSQPEFCLYITMECYGILTSYYNYETNMDSSYNYDEDMPIYLHPMSLR